MSHHNPLGKIKDVATGAMRVPLSAAGTAFDLAAGTAGHVAKTVADTMAGVAGAKGTKEAEDPVDDLAERSRNEPVNVTEELGLDPTPVDQPEDKPVTSIDAAADPSSVDVTPADIADQVSKDH